MTLEKLIVCVDCKPEVDQSSEGLWPRSDSRFKYDVFWFQVAVDNLYFAQVRQPVQKLVASDRVSTSDIERLTICEKEALGMRGVFSRMRSNTMIVS